MNQLLRIRLEVIDNSVLFQVLDQDEYIPRGANKVFRATNNWSIVSNEFPELFAGGICLQGTDKNEDHRPNLYYVGSPQEAAEIKQEILDALGEYCQTFSTTPPPNGPNLYTFYTN